MAKNKIFCYNKAILSTYYKAISPARRESSVDKLVAGLGGTPEALLMLKQDIGTPKTGEVLLSAKEAVSKAAGATLQEIARLKDAFLNQSDEQKKVVMGMAAAGFVAWALSPEKEAEEGKKKEEPEKKESAGEIPARRAEEKTEPLPPIPAKVLAEIEIRAENFSKLYESYKNEKDPKKKKELSEQIQKLFEKATGVHESGNRGYLLNMYAARPDQKLGRALTEMGIKTPPFIFNNSSSLLGGKGEHLKDYPTFKKRVCDSLQPDVKDEKKRVDNTTEILARCAIGKYQVLPIYFFKSMGWSYQGEKGLKDMFDFLSSESRQKEVADKIITRLGKKYDWNPLYMAAAYYAGEKWGDRLRDAPQDNALDKEQGRYRSIKGYARHTCELMDKLVRKT